MAWGSLGDPEGYRGGLKQSTNVCCMLADGMMSDVVSLNVWSISCELPLAAYDGFFFGTQDRLLHACPASLGVLAGRVEKI